MAENKKDDVVEKVNYKEVPGFHVVTADGTHLGTYQSKEDAEAFIEGHLVPQSIKANVVEGVSE